MFYYLIATKRNLGKNQDFLTYHSQQKLSIGQVVLIEVGKATTVGVIFKTVSKPSFTTKQISSSLENAVLPGYLVKASLWLKDYYRSPMANIVQALLPSGITKKRRVKKQALTKQIKKTFKPSPEQQQAIDKISKSPTQTHLLFGLTGSGKTTVYLEVINKLIKNNQSALVIVPEISLTSQLIKQFQSYFDNLIVQHSNLTESIRHQNWQQCLLTKQPLVVIGTRSALFLPINNLGLIIIDEAHELGSLKNGSNPKYLASRLAAKISKQLKIPLILGSATPDVGDYFLAEQKNSSVIKLSTKPVVTTKPKIEVVDSKQISNFDRHHIFSNQLLASIKQSLEADEQVLLFHNRRGSSSASICQKCGWVNQCPNCHIPLTLHHDQFKLRCHNCNLERKITTSCPECKSSDIKYKGIGTKLIEAEIKKLFPKAKVIRFDGDNKSNSLEKLYQQVKDNQYNIIIGTQIVAKGLNLPFLSTVGIIQADTGLFMPDYNASQKTFQLINQVIGRVGRTNRPSRAVIQTYHPDHHAIISGINQDFVSFYNKEIKVLRQNNFPPFCFLLKLSISYKTEAACIKNANKLANKLMQDFEKIELFGPAPSFYERANNRYNWQIIVKSFDRQQLQKVIDILPPKWQYDLDLISLL